MLKTISRDDLLAMASLEVKQGEAMVRKQFICDDIKAVAAADGTASRCRKFVISTGSVDRDNDIVDVEGWQLQNYRRNPVVLWAHDYSSLPIARAIDVHIEGKSLVAVAEFATHELANTVLNLIDGGFLRATSVGFRPAEYASNHERRGIDFSKQELLEFSVVPVPSNPDALIVARSAGADLDSVTTWAKGVLSSIEKGTWVSDAELAQLRAAADAAASAVTPEAIKAAMREVVREEKDTLIVEEDNADHLKDHQCCGGGGTCTNDAGNQCSVEGCDHFMCRDHTEGHHLCTCCVSAKAADDVVFLDIDGNDADEDVSKEDISAALRDIVRELVGATIKNETHATLNRLRGRVD